MGKIAVLTGNHEVGLYCTEKLVSLHPDRVGFVAGLSCNSKIYNECKRWDIPQLPYEDEDQIIELIRKHDVTTLLLAWWPKIVKKVNKLGINVINTHPSYLPYNRGKYPYYWAIVDGTPFGVTIHYVDEGIDTGNILWRKKIRVLPTDTGGSLYNASICSMKMLFLQHLDEIAHENFPSTTPQDQDHATAHHSREFEIEPITTDGMWLPMDLLNDLRGRTFDNSWSGRKVIIDDKTYRISFKLTEVNDD